MLDFGSQKLFISIDDNLISVEVCFFFFGHLPRFYNDESLSLQPFTLLTVIDHELCALALHQILIFWVMGKEYVIRELMAFTSHIVIRVLLLESQDLSSSLQ